MSTGGHPPLVDSLPKYREMVLALKAELKRGYAPGQRLPSEAELMERFHASRSTVIRALRDLKKDGVIVGRQGAGNFVTNAPAPGAQQRFGILSELVPGRDLPCMLTELQLQLAILAQHEGHATDNPTLAHGPDPSTVARQMLEKGVKGVFLVPMELPGEQAPRNRRLVDLFTAAQVPVVLLDRDIVDFPARSEFDLVAANHRQIGFLATRHLLSLGCRRILFIGVEWMAPAVTERLNGYRDALHRAGVEPVPELVCHDRTEFDREWARRLIDETRADAVLCKSDKFAARMMGGLLQAGLRIPDDVQLMGMGDEPFSASLPIPLTTVRAPVADLADAAWRVMRERVVEHREGPGRLVQINCEVVERETTRPAPQAAALVQPPLTPAPVR